MTHKRTGDCFAGACEICNPPRQYQDKSIATLEEQIAELQAQVDRYKKTCKWCGVIHHAGQNTLCPVTQKDKVITKLQAQLLKVTNENRKLLDPSGELLPPLTAIKGEK